MKMTKPSVGGLLILIKTIIVVLKIMKQNYVE